MLDENTPLVLKYLKYAHSLTSKRRSTFRHAQKPFAGRGLFGLFLPFVALLLVSPWLLCWGKWPRLVFPWQLAPQGQA
jgi:hypothetical protein